MWRRKIENNIWIQKFESSEKLTFSSNVRNTVRILDTGNEYGKRTRYNSILYMKTENWCREMHNEFLYVLLPQTKKNFCLSRRVRFHSQQMEANIQRANLATKQKRRTMNDFNDRAFLRRLWQSFCMCAIRHNSVADLMTDGAASHSNHYWIIISFRSHI